MFFLHYLTLVLEPKPNMGTFFGMRPLRGWHTLVMHWLCALKGCLRLVSSWERGLRMYLWSCTWAETCHTVGDIVLLDGKSNVSESNHDAAVKGARFANEGARCEPVAPSTSRNHTCSNRVRKQNMALEGCCCSCADSVGIKTCSAAALWSEK